MMIAQFTGELEGETICMILKLELLRRTKIWGQGKILILPYIIFFFFGSGFIK
jgi:hypothetical protein